jgi:CxxC-x17-CxxC domain-containing protein
MSKVKKCQQCNKQFRLIDMELEFYRKQGYPDPNNCPTCRQKRREALRNPRQFFKKDCDKCGQEMITTHDPKLKRIVYCMECFQDYFNRVDPLKEAPSSTKNIEE